MSETFCGRNCELCEWKEQHRCAGCKDGPGSALFGDCEIARCCREKGHESCGTCTLLSTCGKWSGRDHVPEVRQNLIDAKEARQAELARHAPVLGRWLWVLFWLLIPGTIANLMTMDQVVEAVPWLLLPGTIISYACALTRVVAFWNLRNVHSMYRMVYWCSIVDLAAAPIIELVPEDAVGWLVLLMVVLLPVSFWGTYNEYMAHAAMLAGLDDELSENWRKLWKWYIGLFLSLFGCVLVMLIIPVVGALALIAAAIGTIVISILGWVCLYRTAKLFREFQP